MQPTLFENPSARSTDPDTSRIAAASVKPANSELIRAIRQVVDQDGPLTHEAIVPLVELQHPGRWLQGTIVSACARAYLSRWGTEVVERDNGTKRPIATWVCGPRPTETIRVGSEVV